MAEPRADRFGESPEPMLQFFVWEHLPPHLQQISRPFGLLAEQMIRDLERNPERTVMLRKLLEAKDAAVRAKIYVSVGPTRVSDRQPGSDYVPRIGENG